MSALDSITCFKQNEEQNLNLDLNRNQIYNTCNKIQSDRFRKFSIGHDHKQIDVNKCGHEPATILSAQVCTRALKK